MAKQLNKKLVVGLTIVGMAVTTVGGVVLVAMLPERHPSYYVEKAEHFANEGAYAKALQLYMRAWRVAQGDPGANDYMVKAGRMALELGQAGEALKIWARAVMNDPGCEAAQEEIVSFKLSMAEMLGARLPVSSYKDLDDEAQKLLDINEENVVALYAQAVSRLRRRTVNEKFAESVDDDPEAYVFKSSDDDPTVQAKIDATPVSGVPRLIRAARNAPDDPKYASALSSFYLGENKIEEARRVQEALLAKAPNSGEAWRAYGAFIVQLENIEQLQWLRESQSQARMPEKAPKPQADRDADREKHLTEAQEAFEKAVTLDPDDAGARVALGQFWAERYRLNQAAAQFEADEATREAKLAEADEEAAKAEEILRDATKLDPTDFEAYFRLGNLLRTRGQLDKAQEVYDAREKLGIVRQGYKERWERQGWLRLLNESFRVTLAMLSRPNADVEALFAKAEQLYESAEADAAYGANDPTVLTMRGRLLMETARYPDRMKRAGTDATTTAREAITAFEEARKLSGTTGEIEFFLAQLYNRVGETGLCQQALERVVRAAPRNAPARAMLADIYFRNNKPQQALEQANASLSLNPSNRQTLVVKIRAMAQVGAPQEEIEAAQAQLAGLGEPGKGASAAMVRAVVKFSQAQESGSVTPDVMAEVAAELGTALRENPTDLAVIRQLCNVLIQMDKRSEAMAILSEARAACEETEDPDRKKQQLRALDLIAVLAEPGHSDEERLKMAEELLAQRTGSPDDDFMRELSLAQLYMTNRHPKQALSHVDNALKLRPQEARGLTDMRFRAAILAKEWELAKETAEQAGRMDPPLDSAGGNLYMGRYHLARAEVDETALEKAIPELRAALDLVPSHSVAHILLGQALLESQQTEEAEDEFTKAISINPNSGLAHLGLARIAKANRRQAEFETHLARCKQLLPNHPWVRNELQHALDRKDPEAGIARRERLRESAPNNVENLLQLAELYAQTDKNAEAEVTFKHILELDPKNGRAAWRYARYLRGVSPAGAQRATNVLQECLNEQTETEQKAKCQLLLAQHLRALYEQKKGGKQATLKQVDEAFSAASEIASTYEVLVEIGRWYMDTKRYEQAADMFRKSLGLAEGKTGFERQATRFLIDCLIQIRDPQREAETQREIDAYREKWPTDNIALLFQAEFNLLTGRENKALGLFDEYLRIEPKNAVASFRRGYAYFRLGKFIEAIPDLQEAKALQPNAFGYEHRVALARALELTGQVDLAINELRSILDDDPEAENIPSQLVRLFTRHKRWESAEAFALAQASVHPEDSAWPTRLGFFYEQMGQLDKAERAYIKAVTVAQQHAPKTLSKAVDTVLLGLLRMGRPDRAISYFEKEVPQELRQPLHRARVAKAYSLMKDKSRAGQEYEKALAEAEGSFQTLGTVAEAAANDLGMESAMEIIHKRIAERPDDRSAKFGLAMLQRKNHQPAETIESLKALIATSTAAAEKQLLMKVIALEYIKAEDYASAQKTCQEILEVHPDDLVVLNNLAYVLMDKLDQPEKALPYSKRAVTLAPRRAEVLDTLGWNLVLVGDFAGALRYTGAGIDSQYDDPSLYYHRAIAYERRSATQTDATARQEDLDNAGQSARFAYRFAALAYQKSPSPSNKQLLDDVRELCSRLGITDLLASTRPASG